MSTDQGPVVTRPPHYPTLYTHDTVRHLIAFGLKEDQICIIMKCTLDDLRTYYAEDLEYGMVRVNAQVQAALLHEALYERDVPAMKLWLINKAGWKAGDQPRLGAGLGDQSVPQEGELTIIERKTVIERMLRVATEARIADASVIEGELVPAGKKNGNGSGNGAGSNGSGNGAGSNGSGNGMKHK